VGDPIDILHELIEAGWLPPDKARGRGRNRAAIPEAARLLGCTPVTVHDRLRAIKRSDGREPDWSRYRPLKDQFSTYEEIHAPPPAEKPRVRVKAYTNLTPPDGPIYRILGIGDAHDKPGRDKSRFTWIGRHAAETKPDKIVSIGDFLSLDSLARHPPPGSERDASRPPFFEELESGEEALALIDRECPEIEKWHTHGNHEHRAWTAADNQPKLCGDMPTRVDEVFARFRWTTLGYRRPLYIGGVLFFHVPCNVMGKEYGGKHAENTINNDSIFSTVWGHDHRYRVKTMYKIPDRRIDLLNLGTALPYGVVEDYSVGLTGWTYGIVDITIQGGNITSNRFHSMLELAERYK
jgi:hypothetical protein